MTVLTRLSSINPGCPWRGILPIPDGTVEAADRQVVPYLYAGILAGGAPVVSGLPPYVGFHVNIGRPMGSWG